MSFIGYASLIYGFLMQIFIICLFGQIICTEYDTLAHQLYSSDWPGSAEVLKRASSKNMNKIFIIFIEILKDDKAFMIAKVFPLNLITFKSVSRSLPFP